MEELRKQCMAWLEQTNPLRGLSITRAGSIYDMARKFGSPRLQYTYNEIEKTDPVVYVCCDRRESALAGLEWAFVPRACADETLAKEQADALTRFTDQIDNFSEAITHLDSAFFRGFAHAQPIWEGIGDQGSGIRVSHINLLDSWNFLTDPDGNWYWNPACHETPSGLDTVEGAQLVSLTRRRSIDYPILFIYIRKALGERDYGRFIERHGIPHAAIVMAPGTEEKDVAKYTAAANAWNNGQDLALPNGSDIKLATEARGTDPFTPFVEHQDKYTVLLATGATLTTLAQADTGSLAGGAHMEVWREIVARDGVKIAEALNRDLFRRYLELEFPGRPMAAKFVLSNEKKQTANEVADLAGKLRTAGYLVDQAVLEEKVGMKLFKEESSGGLGSLAGLGGLMHNKQPPEPPKPENNDILAAFAKDMSPAGKAVAELLKNPSKEAAETLLAKLDTLLPGDPATAAVIAEAMAAGFGANVKNKIDDNGVSHSDSNGQFDGGNGSSAKAKMKAEKRQRQADNKNAELKGMSSVEGGSDCRDFMRSQKLGRIAFYQGNDKEGYLHIKNNPDPNHQAMLKDGNIPNTLAYGKYYKDTYQKFSGWSVVNGDKCVFLGKDGDGVKIITAYVSSAKAAAFKRRTAIENKEV